MMRYTDSLRIVVRLLCTHKHFVQVYLDGI